MQKVTSLIILVLLVVGMRAQIIDHTTLLPDDLLIGDTVVTNAPAQVNRYVELPKDVLDSIAAVEDSIAIADSIAAVLDSLALKDSLDHVRALAAQKPLKPVPEYMRQSVYRSWRRSHPLGPTNPIARIRRSIRIMADTLRRSVEALPPDTSREDMLFLYDMRLPVINSGYVPADSSLRFYQQVQMEEDQHFYAGLPVSHPEEQYERQTLNEQYRHLVRYKYASADPRRFRYVRRKFADRHLRI